MTTISRQAHAEQVAAWRRRRDERLRSPGGWLALVGLHWLVPGDNHLGAHPANEIVLHGSHIPPRAGTLAWHDDEIRLRPHEGSDLRIHGEPAQETALADDLGGDPTILELATLRMHLIRRGDRMGLRVRDRAAPALAAFAGVENFPIDPSWHVPGHLAAAPEGTTVEIVDITGIASREVTPGTVSFERDGSTWSLRALTEDDTGELFLVFGDATNGRDTYGGGRFVYIDPPASDGTLMIDFNLAYNPPCVFSPYATCPVPPPENRLALRIEAGERRYTAPL